jgi:hypothetical protein
MHVVERGGYKDLTTPAIYNLAQDRYTYPVPIGK